jgi:anti-sigma-K factor RskA
MKPDSDENQFRQFFREQRQDDERRAPRFAQTWPAAAAHAAGRRHLPTFWRLAIATAALIVLGTVVTPVFRHANNPPIQSATASAALLITQWESPTDFLLTTTTVANNGPSATLPNP